MRACQHHSTTNVEICALTSGFFPTHDEAVTVVFDKFCRYHVSFKTTIRHIVWGSTLLGWGGDEKRRYQKKNLTSFLSSQKENRRTTRYVQKSTLMRFILFWTKRYEDVMWNSTAVENYYWRITRHCIGWYLSQTLNATFIGIISDHRLPVR